MNDFEIFVQLDCDDEAHDVPPTFFHSPHYYVRGTERPRKALLFQETVDFDPKEQYLTCVKAAMGRELIESHDDGNQTKKQVKRMLDDWEYILDGGETA